MVTFCLNCGNEKIKSCKFCIRCGSELTETSPLRIFEPGTVLDNRYKIESLLRETNLGMVYKAVDKRFKTLCVVKELLLNYETKNLKSYIENIRKEVKVFCNTRHPCIPVITNFFVEDGRHYLVMDYFEGVSLETLLKEKGSPGLPENDVINWTLQILDMIDYIHCQDPAIIYRDISPDNIMLKEDDRVVFLDFYISTADLEAKAKGVLPAGSYSAPEEKKGIFSKRSDIFSITATMYYLLTGKAKDFSECAHRSITTALPSIHPILAQVVSQGLQVDAEHRYESALVMKQALLNISADKKAMMETMKVSETEIIGERPAETQPLPPSLEPPKATQKIRAAATTPVPQWIPPEPEPPPGNLYDPGAPRPAHLEEEVVEEVSIDVLEETTKKLKYGVYGGGLVLIIIAAVLIYWIYNTSMAEKRFNDGKILFKEGQSNTAVYINNQGSSGYGYAKPKENFSDAITKFQSFLKIKKDSPLGYYLIAQSYYNLYRVDCLKSVFNDLPLDQTNLDKAIEVFKKVLYLDKDFAGAHYYLSRCYHNKGNYIEARKEIAIAAKLTSESPSEASDEMEKKIKEGLESFLKFDGQPDAGLSGARINFSNTSNAGLDITVGKDYYYVTPKGKLSCDFSPGEYEIKVKSDLISFTDIITLEDKTLYNISLGQALEDKYTNFSFDDIKE